jgi:tRNA A-37 threonylcarbamoyl transferase component Bud32
MGHSKESCRDVRAIEYAWKTMYTNNQRSATYFALSSQVALLSNEQLITLFSQNKTTMGWGKNQVLEIGGRKVFIKRVPITDLEYQNSFSTENFYHLPLYYNYGVGSAGFGVFRELIAHIKTTNWVLSGECTSFPLLYHYRILPFSGEHAPFDEAENQNYVSYWGGDSNIGRYIKDRSEAKHELVLFLEYFPYVLSNYLPGNAVQTPQILSDLFSTVNFLRKNDFIHFDAHYNNILTDGERAYLTDFGLVLDKDYLTSQTEIDFFERHINYDYGEIINYLAFIATNYYDCLSDDSQAEFCNKYSIEYKSGSYRVRKAILENIDDIRESNILKLNEVYCDCLSKYKNIILLIDDFFAGLCKNNAKDTLFPYEELEKLLVNLKIID